jgi:hypothetical protein
MQMQHILLLQLLSFLGLMQMYALGFSIVNNRLHSSRRQTRVGCAVKEGEPIGQIDLLYDSDCKTLLNS